MARGGPAWTGGGMINQTGLMYRVAAELRTRIGFLLARSAGDGG